jgi:hypothetical protein
MLCSLLARGSSLNMADAKKYAIQIVPEFTDSKLAAGRVLEDKIDLFDWVNGRLLRHAHTLLTNITSVIRVRKQNPGPSSHPCLAFTASVLVRYFALNREYQRTVVIFVQREKNWSWS